MLTKTDGADFTSYDYDVFGNLLSVTPSAGPVIEYIVDGEGRRIGKRVGGSLAQGLLWQSDLAPAAAVDASMQVVSRFVYAMRLNSPDYMTLGNQTLRVVYDHLGSQRLIIDAATGAVAGRFDYDEWGRKVGSPEVPTAPFGFAGGLDDLDSALVRFGKRDFSSVAGAWTSKDPRRFSAGDSGLYSYAHGDPVNGIDSFGLETCVAVWTGLADLHAAMAISNGGDAVLFDPSGHYPGPGGDSSPTRGSADTFYDDEASFGDLLNYWGPIQGDPPEIHCFGTTDRDEAEIAQRIDELSPRDSSFGCAADVSRALEGIGPFDSVTPTSWPPSLARQLRNVGSGNGGGGAGGW
jgi:RHS repeat-associated protein